MNSEDYFWPSSALQYGIAQLLSYLSVSTVHRIETVYSVNRLLGESQSPRQIILDSDSSVKLLNIFWPKHPSFWPKRLHFVSRNNHTFGHVFFWPKRILAEMSRNPGYPGLGSQSCAKPFKHGWPQH